MATNEWERREEKNHQLLKEQTRAIQRAEAAQQADLYHAALVREQELEVAREAAEEAREASRLAEVKLEEQREHQEAVEQHNFTMWRHSTDYGKRYDQWRRSVAPLLKELSDRDKRWEHARADDLAARRSAIETESIAAFELEGPAPKTLEDLGREPSRGAHIATGFFGGVALVVVATIVLGLGSWFFIGGILWAVLHAVPADVGGFIVQMVWTLTPIIGLSLTVLFVVVDAIRYHPIRTKQYIQKLRAVEWTEDQMRAYTVEEPPAAWDQPTDVHLRRQIDSCRATIDGMPYTYHDFDPSGLPAVPNGLPMPINAGNFSRDALICRRLVQQWEPRSRTLPV